MSIIRSNPRLFSRFWKSGGRRFCSEPSRESILSSSIINNPPPPPDGPPSISEDRSPWRFLKYGIFAALTGGVCATGYATYAYSSDEIDEKTKELRASAKLTIGDDASPFDKFKAYTTFGALAVPSKLVELYLQVRRLTEEKVLEFTEPTSDKLLPDLHPVEKQFVFTLVLDLNETLVFSDWKRERGWRTFKRPGVDAFLKHLGQMFEIVIYSDQLSMYVDPVIEKLDTEHSIRYRLARGATRYINGKHYRDLSKLNRDPKRIIYISGHALESSLQPENSIEIKAWQGDLDDTALLDLIPFLEFVAKHPQADIRTVLASYQGQDIAKEFIQRSKTLERRMQENKQGPFGGVRYPSGIRIL